MKKFLAILFTVAMLATMTVNCFASTAVTDLDLIFFDDFSDAKKHDYEASDSYLAEIDDQSLFIQPLGGSWDSYILPGSPELSGLDKMTIVYRFKYETVDHNKALLVSFGGDETNFFTVGFNLGLNFVEGEGAGVKFYYAPVENNKLIKYEGASASTRRWQYQGLKENASSAEDFYMLNGDDWYTFIFEIEKGKDPVCTFYTNDQRVVTYGGPVFGGGSLSDGGDYLFSTDPNFTLDGKIGLIRTGAGMFIDGIAFYKTTGLNYDELVEKVASEGGAGASAPAETDPAPAETDPAPAETDPAPAETNPAPAETDPAPAETDPAPAETDPAPVETDPAPAETDPAPAEGGCGGVIGVGALVAILGCAVVLKKKD